MQLRTAGFKKSSVKNPDGDSLKIPHGDRFQNKYSVIVRCGVVDNTTIYNVFYSIDLLLYWKMFRRVDVYMESVHILLDM